jgi:hypothetical protein
MRAGGRYDLSERFHALYVFPRRASHAGIWEIDFTSFEKFGFLYSAHVSLSFSFDENWEGRTLLYRSSVEAFYP